MLNSCSHKLFFGSEAPCHVRMTITPETATEIEEEANNLHGLLTETIYSFSSLLGTVVADHSKPTKEIIADCIDGVGILTELLSVFNSIEGAARREKSPEVKS